MSMLRVLSAISFAGYDLSPYLTEDVLAAAAHIAGLVLIGIPLLYVFTRQLGKAAAKRFTPQSAMIVRKGVWYLGLALIAVTIIHHLNFQLTAILGAAGILSVAIGFAAQTSFSNLISGLFLVGEKPFAVGDVVRIGSTTGVVLSIDLLSLKLRTFDNQFIRIPNETVMKTEVSNITRFPIRRIDIPVQVAYKEDLDRVATILKDLADSNPTVLDEPEPMILFQGFGESGIDILFAVWAARADFLAVKRSLMPQIKNRFDAEGIEIPFPHRTLYTGAVTAPLPVKVVSEAPADGA